MTHLPLHTRASRQKPTSWQTPSLTRTALAVQLMFSALLCAHPAALAQSPDHAAPQADPPQRQALRHAYDIPAGPLDDALARFAQISGSLIASTPEQVRGRTSPGLTGGFSPQQALDALLVGTGLRARRDPQGQFTLHNMPDDVRADVATLAAVTVVSAAGHEQAVRNAPASISVITRQELENRQFDSLQDIVRDVPGVAVVGGGQGSGISIRGMEKEFTLILVDGMRVRSETTNPRDLNQEDLNSNYIPPLASIDRIEIIRGPMSSLYGSDAVGGMINVITKKTPQAWNGSVSFGVRKPDSGSMADQRQKNAHVSGSIIPNLLGLSVWGNETKQDADGYNGGYQASTKRTVGGKLRFTPNDRHDLTLNVSDANQRYDSRDWTRKHWAVAWNAQFDVGHLELKYHKEDYERLTYPANNTSYITGSTNRVADARFVTWLGAHTLSLGTQWVNDRLTNRDLGGIRRSNGGGTRKSTETAAFVEDEWELLSDKLFLTTGARLTHNDFFGNRVSPRAYLVFHQSDRLTFKGGVATGYKRPKITQIDGSTASQRGSGANQFQIVGNPDLKPETSVNIEVSALYTANDAFSGSVTLFHTDFNNKIISTNGYYFDDGAGGIIPTYCDSGRVGARTCPAWGTWLNLDGAKNRGVELDGRWTISSTLKLKGNYTYTHSRVALGGDTVINTPAGPRRFGQTLGHLDGNSLAGVPKHNGSITLDWLPTSALSSFLRLNYEGQIATISFENSAVNKSEKDLITLDAGLRYTFNRHFSVNFTVDNITDAKRFKINQNTGAYRYSERGRSYYASVRGQF